MVSSAVPRVVVINIDLSFLLLCTYTTVNQNRKRPSL